MSRLARRFTTDVFATEAPLDFGNGLRYWFIRNDSGPITVLIDDEADVTIPSGGTLAGTDAGDVIFSLAVAVTAGAIDYTVAGERVENAA